MHRIFSNQTITITCSANVTSIRKRNSSEGTASNDVIFTVFFFFFI